MNIDGQFEIKHNLLVIDDEVDITKSLFRQFRRKYHVFVANSADEALPILEKEDIQVVLSDQRMPGMTGINFFNAIKNKFPDTLKLILTGYSDIEAVITAINEGQVFRYLTKPWNPLELNIAIKEAFDQFDLLTYNKVLYEKLSQANSNLEKKVAERTKELLYHQNNLETIIKDRTSQLEESKEKAEESDRLKSAFLANVGHEIRTPMNAIIGFSFLLKGLVNGSKQNKYLNSIETSAKYLLTLITDILDLSEIESGNLKMKHEWVESKLFFEEIIPVFEKEINESNLVFKFDVNPNMPTNLFVDVARVRQIITNLLSNAIKFTPVGFVKFSIDYTTNKAYLDKYVDVRIVVEDSGIGISPEYQQKLFMAFSQQDDQTIRKYEGTGLGLALCQKLAHVMNGTIEVDSEIDKGSKFTVILPKIEIEKQDDINTKKTAVDINTITFKETRILLVDNIEFDRAYINAVLKDMPIHLDYADNGEEAYEILKTNSYSLVLVNVELAIYDGFGLMKKILANSSIANLPVIALSSSLIKQDQIQIKEAGFVASITKPFVSKDIHNALIQYIKHSKKESTTELKTKILPALKLSLTQKKELVELLNGYYLDKWKLFESRYSIRKIQSFATELQALTEKYPHAELILMAKRLIESVDNFDITELQILIKQYPQLILKIESEYTE